MENFVVSARKYRPITFDAVVGQSHITTTLRNAIKNNHLAQAFLFCGPRGVGKTTCARILAKTINCLNIQPNIEPCNECESCKSFANNSSFNIHELDAASNNSVDDIRSLVEQVRYPPQSGRYKIYIIDEVHMLSTAAFNAFLKTLEEPPKYAIFILATTEKHKIIPTILSRCQIFDFNRIQVKDIADHLGKVAEKEDLQYEPEALHLIAQKADGALRDALSMFDLVVTFSSDRSLTYKAVIDNLNVLDYEYYFKVTDMLIQEQIHDVLLVFDEILKHGFDGHQFIIGLSEHLRNLLVCRDKITVQLLEVAENVQAKYLAQAQKTSPSFLISALNIINQADINYKSSKNQRLHVEMALIKLCYINSALHFSQNPSIPEREAKKKTEPVAANDAATSYVIADNHAKTSAPPPVPKPRATSPQPALKATLKINTSLKDIAERLEMQRKEAGSETGEAELSYGDKDFSKEELIKVWEEFAEQRKSLNKYNEYSLLQRKELVLKGAQIIFPIDNAVQNSHFQAVKDELHAYLRKELHNSGIQVTCELSDDDAPITNRLYTPKDKFEYMVEQNPVLLTMKQRWGLDFS